MGTEDILPTEGVRFSAFVSYSHVDSATARKLHRKIETYKLPKRLRHLQTGSAKGAASDGRVGQIFRDRDDLPAALDLSESVKEALTQSRALIVICSPAAKASPWVNKEITLFRELHPDRPILAALVAGEPDEAFPEALLVGGEPLAADLRKESDGWRLGLLKLIAGIAELPLDSLVQRDAQRHLRRVMAVTGGTVVALLAMIGMTIFALQSRNEAQQQQAQAEGLVEYMLTDLRDELKGVGRLDVMTDVNERAMDYYEGQGDLSDLPAASLERRARILHAMGEDDEDRGDLNKALAKFTEAHRVTATLLAQDLENGDRIFGHAQSEYWVGYSYRKNDNMNLAIKHYEKYLAAANDLNRIEKGSHRAILELAYANNNLGIIELYTNKSFKKARFYFSNELRQYEKLDIAGLSITESLYFSNCYDWIANTYFAENQFDDSIKNRKISIALKKKILLEHPAHRDAQIRLARSLRVLAISNQKMGRIDDAKQYIREAYDLAQNLHNLDDTNQDWQNARTIIAEDLKSMNRGE